MDKIKKNVLYDVECVHLGMCITHLYFHSIFINDDRDLVAAFGYSPEAGVDDVYFNISLLVLHVSKSV